MGRRPDRIAFAREFGATEIEAERGDEVMGRGRNLSGGLGAHAVLECVGSEKAFTRRWALSVPVGR